MDDLWTWSDDAVDLTPEQNRWRARDVSYYRGPWDRLKKLIPSFGLAPFRTDKDGPENRHLRMVVRQPVAQTESHVAATRRDAMEQQKMLQGLDTLLAALKRTGG